MKAIAAAYPAGDETLFPDSTQECRLLESLGRVGTLPLCLLVVVFNLSGLIDASIDGAIAIHTIPLEALVVLNRHAVTPSDGVNVIAVFRHVLRGGVRLSPQDAAEFWHLVQSILGQLAKMHLEDW